jgi:D-glycero-alpha-D-manno-heptose-7-phosphate kinase
MIVSKTPFRISFIGGGTDYCDLSKESPGHVISTTINKYMYIFLNKKFDNNFRISYSLTENCKNLNQIKHKLIRETLKYFNISPGIEIATIADIPSSGSGLGSSSSLVVGLINSICKLKNKSVTSEFLAKTACHIETDICNKPIGMQDQYSASHGGLNEYKFFYNKKVETSKINISKKRLNEFKNKLLLFYTGVNRQTDKILDYRNLKVKLQTNKILKEFVTNFKYELIKGNLNNLGAILHESWVLKKKTSKKVSNSYFDSVYSLAIKSGALGGKLLGAGGGGFFLFYADTALHDNIIKKLYMLKPLNFDFIDRGSEALNI